MIAAVRVPCEVFSRIVGYLTPIQNWNAGKVQEFRERVVFRIPAGLEGEDPEREGSVPCLSP